MGAHGRTVHGYQPRRRHSGRDGRSRPSEVGLPCPGWTIVSSGSRSNSSVVTSRNSESKAAASFHVFPTPPGKAGIKVLH